MSENRPINGEQSVDRREQTTVTQEPGYATSEHMTRDVAAERRQGYFMVTRIIWTLVGILEIFLGLRFVLKLIAANASSGFAVFIYGATSIFVAPFRALVGTPTSGETVLEVTTLIAMAVYALFAWILTRVIRVSGERPIARTVSRSVSERTPSSTTSGTETERTTHTINKS